MTATATARPSPRGPWSPRTPSQNPPVPSTTPAGYPVKTPGQPTPRLSSKALSPHSARPQRSSSPNYFEFVTDPGSNPPNSNAGMHAKKNWSPPSAGDKPRPAASPPPNYPLDSHPRFESFRRQSENNSFTLGHGNLSHFSGKDAPSAQSSTIEGVANQSHRRRSVISPKSHGDNRRSLDSDGATGDGMDIDQPSGPRPTAAPLQSQEASFFDHTPRLQSKDNVQSPGNISQADLPALQRNHLSHIDERHPRNSLPNNRIEPVQHAVQRSETLPSSISTDGPTMVAPQDVMEIIKGHLPQDVLILDLRVSPQFSKSRISNAINLCIPTTLLKRASFTVQKLSETFTNKDAKSKFDQWKEAKFIIVYDANSVQLKDATSSANTLKKFTNEKWPGATLVIRGGFNAFHKKCPEQVDEKPIVTETDGSSAKNLSIEPPAAAPVAGGCMMPAAKTAANPFFGTIRQNMDLIGGVGQMDVKLPSGLKEIELEELPTWLRKAANVIDKGKAVADHFLGIEEAEQRRMQKALNVTVQYGTPNPRSPEAVQMAGIEKGAKNRYKDILPFDHSRVRLQNVSSGGCDYVNASHLKAQYSNRNYIASQAPVPATFQDFWRVAWEQDARVIVMLTAETEGGQRKCHPYWLTGDYGAFKVKELSERHLALDQTKLTRSVTSPPVNLGTKDGRPSMGRRRSTNYASQHASAQSPAPIDPNTPHIIVRKLTLSHANHPFEPLREITQLQYSSWPDFGTPAHPAHVLGLVEHCSTVVCAYETGTNSRSPEEAAREGERPIVVHCSAGCGRTGTFCTVDSVIDMLKRQRQHRDVQDNRKLHESDEDAMDVDSKEEEAWIGKDDEDLVTKAVSDFRLQRLSMVQTLRQFVLCYETVLEWIVAEMPVHQKGMGGGADKHRSWGGPV